MAADPILELRKWYEEYMAKQLRSLNILRWIALEVNLVAATFHALRFTPFVIPIILVHLWLGGFVFYKMTKTRRQTIRDHALYKLRGRSFSSTKEFP